MKYLAIKNWEKYQPNERLRKKDAKLPWVKSYTDKEDDYEYGRLSLFARALLDGIQRLRGRTARNPHNDATWIARALCVVATDRPHVQYALDTLIARGFLIPTNQEVGSREGDRDREGDTEREKEAESVPVSLPVAGQRGEFLAPEGTDECVEQIQRAWKKPCGQAGMTACVEAFEYESKTKRMGFLEAARHVRDKTLIIADLLAEWPPGEHKFIPKLTDFMKTQGYEQPYTTWERRDGNKSQQPTGRSAADILREREQRTSGRTAGI